MKCLRPVRAPRLAHQKLRLLRPLSHAARIAGCVLVLGPGVVSAMEFEAGEHCEAGVCQPALYARGVIDKESFAQFSAALNDAPAVKLVVFDSKGGSLGQGLKIGNALRARRLNTRIERECFSACAYAFLGGVERVVATGAKFGVHQFRGDETLDVANAQKLSALIGRYLDTMGVDRRLLDAAQLTTSDRVAVLSPQQLANLRIDSRTLAAPRWRLEASANGTLLALQSTTLSLGRSPLWVGLTRARGGWRMVLAASGLVEAESLRGGTSLSILIGAERIDLAPAGNWQMSRQTRQIWFGVPDAAIEMLTKLDEKSGFQLVGPLPLGASGVQVSANGLTNVLAAIRRSSIAPGDEDAGLGKLVD